MSMIKTFKVCGEFNDELFVTLQVDTDKLTPALASQINSFWGDAEARLETEDGDAVKAVIRLYGARVIRLMLEAGGNCFTASRSRLTAQLWTEAMQAEEGWPGHDGTLFGAAGIRVIEAQVEMPGFDEVELTELTA